MKCEKYNDLVENLKFKDSKEFMDVLNKRIDKAVSESGDPVLYYEELICYLKKMSVYQRLIHCCQLDMPFL